MGLLERDEQLAILLDRFEQVDIAGRLVLVSGEAGVGKTALVQEFVDRLLPGSQVLLGRCDDLFAARPFGPFADIARTNAARWRLRSPRAIRLRCAKRFSRISRRNPIR